MAHQNSQQVLNEWQSQQIAQSTTTLRALNRLAGFELQLVLSPHASRKSYQQAREAFTRLAIQIHGTVEFRQEVLAADPERTPDAAFVFCCPSCGQKKPPAEPDEQQLESVNTLKLDPEHHQEVEALLELGQRVLEFAAMHESVRKFCKPAFFRALERLNNALRKQRRQLRQVYPARAASVRFIADTCFSCHRPMAEAMRDYPIPAPDLPAGP
jgi:hypothetical protein